MKWNERPKFIQVGNPGERPSTNQSKLSRRLEAYINPSGWAGEKEDRRREIDTIL
jgi:hypothetical protein